jgi:hypothetical protein
MGPLVEKVRYSTFGVWLGRYLGERQKLTVRRQQAKSLIRQRHFKDTRGLSVSKQGLKVGYETKRERERRRGMGGKTETTRRQEDKRPRGRKRLEERGCEKVECVYGQRKFGVVKR